MSCGLMAYFAGKKVSEETRAADSYILKAGAVLLTTMVAGYLATNFISTPDPRSAEGDLVSTLTHTSTKLVGDK